MNSDKYSNIFNNKNSTQSKDEDCEQIICKKTNYQKQKKSSFLNSLYQKRQCPLNRQTLGMYSWSILHTLAAYYPQNPTQIDKQKMKGILEGFRHFYPCKDCRAHFQKTYDKQPPILQNQKQLSFWVCKQHNFVNKILGKKQFDCSEESLLKRWKTGCNDD